MLSVGVGDLVSLGHNWSKELQLLAQHASRLNCLLVMTGPVGHFQETMGICVGEECFQPFPTGVHQQSHACLWAILDSVFPRNQVDRREVANVLEHEGESLC